MKNCKIFISIVRLYEIGNITCGENMTKRNKNFRETAGGYLKCPIANGLVDPIKYPCRKET